jgi:hypothetical protein
MATEHDLDFANHIYCLRLEIASPIGPILETSSWGTHQMRLILSLSALAATLVTATPAFATAAPGQGKATAEVLGVVLQPLTLTKVSNLDFGTVIGSTTAGVVTIDPDSGARSITGGVIGVATYPGGRGEFQGAGTPNQTVQLTLSKPLLLTSTTNAGDTLVVTSMTLDNGNSLSRTIDVTSAFTVGVGGVFAIAASQPNGLYSATFDLTADYL